jgi:hypothetical protein
MSATSAMAGGPAASKSGTDSAGLERAQRLAANPLKMILEAGRIDRRSAAEVAAPGASPASPTLRSGSTPPAPSAGPATDAEPAITVIVQLPADLPRVAPLEPHPATLRPAPAPLAPLTLEALRSLPWPAEPSPGASEPRGPRRLAGTADAGTPPTDRQLAQAEPPERP